MAYRRYTFSAPSSEAVEPAPRIEAADSALSGSPVRDLELALGYWFARWLSIGIEGSVGLDFVSLVGIEQMLSAGAGVFGRTYWSEGAHFLGVVGVKHTGFVVTTVDGSGPDSVLGPYLALGVGYDLDFGLTLAVRLEGSSQSESHADYRGRLVTGAVTLQVGYAWH